ncbi:MAG: hypothetical protein J6T14_07100 [Clostridia bacterium]|nr:hypothetical protein [Clostridia bacterium]
MRYRIVLVYHNENGHLGHYRAEYRRWWWPFWKPVISEHPEGVAYDYGNALRAIARTMAVPGGPISIASEYV